MNSPSRVCLNKLRYAQEEVRRRLDLAALRGWGLGLGLPALLQQMADGTRPEDRGLAIGLRQTVNEAAALTTPVALGLASTRIGIEGGWLKGHGGSPKSRIRMVLSPRAGEPSLELDLKAAGQDVRLGPRVVHLAVAARGRDVCDGGATKRYRSVEGAACVDESTGDGAIEIPRMVPAPILLLGWIECHMLRV